MGFNCDIEEKKKERITNSALKTVRKAMKEFVRFVIALLILIAISLLFKASIMAFKGEDFKQILGCVVVVLGICKFNLEL